MMHRIRSVAVLLLALVAFAPIAHAQAPPELYKRVDLTVGEITNLNTSPVTILPAVTGYVYAVEWAIALHEGRYATSPGNLQLRAPGSSLLVYTQWSANGVLLSSTGSPSEGAMSRVWGLGRIDDGAISYGSKGMEAYNVGGNPTVDATYPGSDVSIFLVYRLLPSYVANLPPPN